MIGMRGAGERRAVSCRRAIAVRRHTSQRGKERANRRMNACASGVRGDRRLEQIVRVDGLRFPRRTTPHDDPDRRDETMNVQIRFGRQARRSCCINYSDSQSLHLRTCIHRTTQAARLNLTSPLLWPWPRPTFLGSISAPTACLQTAPSTCMPGTWERASQRRCNACRCSLTLPNPR